MNERKNEFFKEKVRVSEREKERQTDSV